MARSGHAAKRPGTRVINEVVTIRAVTRSEVPDTNEPAKTEAATKPAATEAASRRRVVPSMRLRKSIASGSIANGSSTAPTATAARDGYRSIDQTNSGAPTATGRDAAYTLSVGPAQPRLSAYQPPDMRTSRKAICAAGMGGPLESSMCVQSLVPVNV